MVWFEILGISEQSDLDSIKKAYFKKIKEYPPEEFEREYIEINKAYIEALNSRKKDGLGYLYIKLVKIIEEKDISTEENWLIREIIKGISKDNFTVENDNILKVIKLMREKELKRDVIYLIALAKKRFKELQLMGLSEAYERLESSILEDL
ncbi:J domain-containing protein [Cetobacterium sp.]|uniref:J domain-containing protein n=1 Tax=Cetobacterium sp. TaxID=2071632 RepID=UPI003F37398A